MDLIARLRRGATRAMTSAPAPVLRAIAGGTIERDGQTLDPQVAAILAIARRLGLDRLEERGVDGARRLADHAFADLDADPHAMAQVIETHAPGPAGAIPVRVFRPRGASGAMIVYLHGGGGVIGSIDGYDTVCRLIADETRAVVASVGYRLAPEHRYPAALDDAIAAWRWARATAPALGVDPARLALAGDSMGGYLSVMVERRERSAPRPAALGLIYPAVDFTRSSGSIETFADGFLLTRSLIDWFIDQFCPGAAAQRAASPLFFDDVAAVPPTVIVTAGFDPLRDEGRAWAARLRAAGTHVIHREHASLVHGFVEMSGAVRAARDAVLEFCADLRGLLG